MPHNESKLPINQSTDQPENYHTPVLLQEAIEGLNIKGDGIYVDCTFGGGGHSKTILQHLSKEGTLVAFDQDEDARKNLPADKRVIFVPQNFRHLQRFLRLHKISQVDGILADLGVSSHQFDEAERGFSTRFDAALDRCGLHGGSASGTDTQGSDAVRVHVAQRRQKIDRTINIANALHRIIEQARHPFAFALMRGVKSQRHEPLLRQLLRVQPGSLFLNAAAWVNDNNSSILRPMTEAFRKIEATGKLQAAIVEVNLLRVSPH